jgi:Lon protease-like protein
LYVGQVEWLAAPGGERLPSVHAPLAELLRRLMGPLPLYRGTAPRFDDAAWVGGRLVELLPLALAFKQSLLELPNSMQRLDRLAAALRPRQESE